MERVDIANRALIMLGEQPITAIDEDSNNAQIMKQSYQMARDGTLEAHEWSFAITRFIPAALAQAPQFGYAFAYPIPPEILRVLTVYYNDTQSTALSSQLESSTPQVDWAVEYGRILCNESVIYCRGIKRIEEEGRFSSLFVEAFAAKLAALTAINLTGSAEIQANMLGFFDVLVKQAKSRDGLQGRSKIMRNRQLQSVR
jgi:hypothetical protein